MRTAALLLVLAMPCTLAAQAPDKLEADLAKARADDARDPSSVTPFGFIAAEADVKRGF
jgi:hypothetical protein